MTFMLTTLQHILMLELILYSFAGGAALAYIVWYLAEYY
jgi:hypothetical protein